MGGLKPTPTMPHQFAFIQGAEAPCSLWNYDLQLLA